MTTDLETIYAEMKKLAYKPEEQFSSFDGRRLSYLLRMEKVALVKQAEQLAEKRIREAFYRNANEEEELFQQAGSNLLQVFTSGHQVKPVRVRLADLSGLDINGRCHVSLPSEFRIVINSQVDQGTKYEVFLHELSHAIDAHDPTLWEYLTDRNVQEMTASKRARDLDKVARLARLAVQQAEGRNRPFHFMGLEAEKVRALARSTPEALKAFKRRSWNMI